MSWERCGNCGNQPCALKRNKDEQAISLSFNNFKITRVYVLISSFGDDGELYINNIKHVKAGR